MLKYLLSDLLVFVLLALAPHGLIAEEWQVSGFAIQGITYSSDYNYYGASDDGISTDFSEFGINLNYQLNDRIGFTTQAAYRNSNSSDSTEFFLDVFQLDAQLFTRRETTAGVKLGRFKLKFACQ